MTTRLITGVYMIENKRHRKVYVGSAAQNFDSRWQSHRNALIRGKHFNRHLQSAWDKYGGNAFRFVILERCRPSRCLKREQHWIDWYKSYDNKYGYNSRPKAESNLGAKFGPQTEEAKIKKSIASRAAWKNNPHPPPTVEARARMGSGTRGRTPSPERIAKMLATRATRTYTYSDEMRQGMSESAKKRGISQETREKINKTRRTPECRAKMSASAKRRGVPRSTIENMIAATRGRPWSQARRAAYLSRGIR